MDTARSRSPSGPTDARTAARGASPPAHGPVVAQRTGASQDGQYTMQFSADGFRSTGWLKLRAGRAVGGDGSYRIEGNCFDSAGQLSAVFNVLMPPRLLGNTRVPEHFSLRMTGTTSATGFQLIGTGPLGVIIEIACTLTGPLQDEHRDL